MDERTLNTCLDLYQQASKTVMDERIQEALHSVYPQWDGGVAVQTTSATELTLYFMNQAPPYHALNKMTIAEGGVEELLRVYQEYNRLLNILSINTASLRNGGHLSIANTLTRCTNLRKISLRECSISDEQVIPIVEAVTGHSALEELCFYDNHIGNIGCEAIARLLQHTNCNIRILYLGINRIGNEGAALIANSLVGNNRLRDLLIFRNPIDINAEDIFCKVLCDTTNINSIFSSNHTFRFLKRVLWNDPGDMTNLMSLVRINISSKNKRHVAIKKILKYHPNLDMEPLFEWDAEGEQTLKALPYVISWFGKAKEAIAKDGEDRDDKDFYNQDSPEEEKAEVYKGEDEEYNILQRKLTAILQFARAIPLLFGGIATIKKDRKRKNLE